MKIIAQNKSKISFIYQYIYNKNTKKKKKNIKKKYKQIDEIKSQQILECLNQNKTTWYVSV